ncbi:MAG: hypothetical protein LLG13_04720 [Bacteroidales bacterium]|nr:hypothetical protein [Bacteroidales bacterium]
MERKILRHTLITTMAVKIGLTSLGAILFLLVNLATTGCSDIDRKAVVSRHNVITTSMNAYSPAQVGNGEFAFGADITGLQTFVQYNTMSNWGWHSTPLPEGLNVNDFKGIIVDTHGRPVRYNYLAPWDKTNDPDSALYKQQRTISDWLAANPHRINLGRIGFVLKKANGESVTVVDLKGTMQEIDLWNGIITSSFQIENTPVLVKTACHPKYDAVAVSVESELLKKGQMVVMIDFPYGESNKRYRSDFVGDWNNYKAHQTNILGIGDQRADLSRSLDSTSYNFSMRWTTKAKFLHPDSVVSPHRFYLIPGNDSRLDFICAFSEKRTEVLPSVKETFRQSTISWNKYWKSGAAIDLSGSKDQRWKELERRVVLSQYLMKVNEAGSLPPQESGLVNNGWYGRFHLEMLWWHGVHYALWNRWTEVEKMLAVYSKYLKTSEERAALQGYKGVRWPKCTANFDRDWPNTIHSLLIWQQPHPIYFAELDYRLHPTKATLDKWSRIVFETADFMADYAYYEKEKDRYVLGPPVFIVSENTDPMITVNPSFELGYWRTGLRMALKWKSRMNLPGDKKWELVSEKLSGLPVEDNVYVTYEGIPDMWSKFCFEHPGLTGVFGMLPGEGVDTTLMKNTFNKVLSTWNFNRVWGWDFPMLAMCAARIGMPETAVDMLLHSSPNFQFDEHGLATGGPFPYFPSNGGVLTAVAMMAGGWENSTGTAPGFPKNGEWSVKCEGFNKMP